jgi:cytochrome c5
MRQITPACLAVWMVSVWMAPGVEGTSAAPRVPVPAQAAPAPQPDVERGRVALTQVCVGCHGNGILRMVEQRKKTEQEWRETVYRMIGRGAQVLPGEIEPLTAYLTVTGGQARQASAGAAAAGRRGRPAAAAGGAADGDATAILARRCQLCHDLAKATTKPATAESWDAIIDRMVVLGASVTAAEHQTLTAYLNAQQK